MIYPDLDSLSAKTVALLCHGFGGHPVQARSERLARSWGCAALDGDTAYGAVQR
jgi:hypothetical protein